MATDEIVRVGSCRCPCSRFDCGSHAPSGLQPEHQRRIPADRLELRLRLDFRRSVAPIAVELWRLEHHPANADRREGVEIMKRKALSLVMATTLSSSLALADGTNGAGPARHITLQEAVQLAVKHNHSVRIAGYAADQKQHAKDA